MLILMLCIFEENCGCDQKYITRVRSLYLSSKFKLSDWPIWWKWWQHNFEIPRAIYLVKITLDGHKKRPSKSGFA